MLHRENNARDEKFSARSRGLWSRGGRCPGTWRGGHRPPLCWGFKEPLHLQHQSNATFQKIVSFPPIWRPSCKKILQVSESAGGFAELEGWPQTKTKTRTNNFPLGPNAGSRGGPRAKRVLGQGPGSHLLQKGAPGHQARRLGTRLPSWRTSVCRAL